MNNFSQNKYIVGLLLFGCILIFPVRAHAAGEGLIKSIYCKVIWVFNLECVPEIIPVDQIVNDNNTKKLPFIPEVRTIIEPQTIIKTVTKPVQAVSQTIIDGVSFSYLETRLEQFKQELALTSDPVVVHKSSSSSISTKQIDNIYDDMSDNINDAIDGITDLPGLASLTTSGTATFNGLLNINGELALNGSAGTAGQVLISNGTSSSPTWTTLSVSGSDAGTLDSLDSTDFLQTANNLSDLTSTSNARANLELGSLATLSNLSTFTTDDLTQGSTNLYSQWATSGSDISYLTGNVGIGATPTAKLSVTDGTRSVDLADGTYAINANGDIALSGTTRGIYFGNVGSGAYIEAIHNGGAGSNISMGNVDYVLMQSPLQLTYGIKDLSGFKAIDSSLRQLHDTGGNEVASWGQAGYALTATLGAGNSVTLDDGTYAINATGNINTNSDYYINGSTINVSHWSNDAGYITSAVGQNHGDLSSLLNDDHAQYALLAGRSGGQTLIGGTATTDDLVLRTTSGIGATGADMIFQVGNNGATEAMRILNNGNVGIGTTTPGSKFTLGSGQIEVPLGSASLPSYSFTGDLNTGMYSTTPDQIQFAGGGAVRFQIFTAGVESSAQVRGAGGSAATPTFVSSADSDTGVFFLGSNIMGLTTGGVERMRVDASGNVGIGTTNPISKLHIGSNWTANPNSTNRVYLGSSGFVNTDIAPEAIITTASSNTTPGASIGLALHNTDTTAGGYAPMFVFSKRETGGTAYNASIAGIGARTVTGTGAGDSWIDGELMFYTAPTAGSGLLERMRIDQAGNIGIGTTTPAQKLSVVGSAQFTAVSSGAYAFDLNLTSDGTLTTSASDRRLKENITSLNASSTLEKILLLNPATFDWKSNGAHDIGLIAQEVEEIFPELVFTNKTDGYKGINYSRLPALLISAIQSIVERIDGFAERFQTKELCLEEVCITKTQLQQLLDGQSFIEQNPPAPQNANGTPSGGNDTNQNVPTENQTPTTNVVPPGTGVDTENQTPTTNVVPPGTGADTETDSLEESPSETESESPQDSNSQADSGTDSSSDSGSESTGSETSE